MTNEKINPIEINDEGEIEFNLACDEANGDFIRATRLVDGTKEDKKKLQDLENSVMFKQEK